MINTLFSLGFFWFLKVSGAESSALSNIHQSTYNIAQNTIPQITPNPFLNSLNPFINPFKCPLIEEAGLHNFGESPVLGTRAKELETVTFSKYAPILNKFINTLYPDNKFRALISKSEINEAELIGNQFFQNYIGKYAAYGCTSENILASAGENIVFSRQVEKDNISVRSFHALHSQESFCEEDFCMPLPMIKIHEIMHVEEIPTGELREILTTIKQHIYTDLVYKNLHQINENEIVDYNKSLQFGGKKFSAGELANYYRDLEKKYGNLAKALVSKESIEYLTGMDAAYFEDVEQSTLNLIFNNIEIVRKHIQIRGKPFGPLNETFLRQVLNEHEIIKYLKQEKQIEFDSLEQGLKFLTIANYDWDFIKKLFIDKKVDVNIILEINEESLKWLTLHERENYSIFFESENLGFNMTQLLLRHHSSLLFKKDLENLKAVHRYQEVFKYLKKYDTNPPMNNADLTILHKYFQSVKYLIEKINISTYQLKIMLSGNKEKLHIVFENLDYILYLMKQLDIPLLFLVSDIKRIAKDNNPSKVKILLDPANFDCLKEFLERNENDLSLLTENESKWMEFQELISKIA